MANHTTKIFVLSLFMLFCCAKIFAQTELADTNNVQIDTTKFQMKKSAWGAVLRSAIVPGLGQFYNESYWKIPIVWGALGALGYQWVDRNNLYKKYRDLYSESVSKNNSGNDQYLKIREFYKDQRDLVAVFIGLTYLLNLVDAYVDAHLFDFDVSENNNIPIIQLSLRINF